MTTAPAAVTYTPMASRNGPMTYGNARPSRTEPRTIDAVPAPTRTGHFSWATAPLIFTFVAWMPLYLNYQFSFTPLAHTLPTITSRILTLASISILFTIFISLISLPPRPKRYKGTRFLGMIAQWVLLPVTSMFFAAFAAINAQTRLMFGRYLEFYVTEKATKK